jgi:hypothetical protein
MTTTTNNIINAIYFHFSLSLHIFFQFILIFISCLLLFHIYFHFVSTEIANKSVQKEHIFVFYTHRLFVKRIHTNNESELSENDERHSEMDVHQKQ